MLPLLSNEWFKSMAAVAGGWVLSELSHYLVERRERRKAISRSLSDLLQIRHEFLLVDTVIREITKGLRVSPQEDLQLRIMFNTLLPKLLPSWAASLKTLDERYNESVTLVSSLDPILGFQLRSKELARGMFPALHSIAAQDTQAAQALQLIGKSAFDEIRKEFDSVLKTLAWKLDPVKRWKVGKILRKGLTLPKGLDDLVQTTLKDLQKSAAPPVPPQPPSAAQGAAGT
jgi:hypothetical protein